MTFRMYLTDEDQYILQFVEEHGSITVTQAQNMFYKKQSKGYEMARRHLQKIVSYNRLSVSKDFNSNRNVYYTDKIPSYHTILMLDYYAHLVKAGATIRYFKMEQPWMKLENGKPRYFSDAYALYQIGKKVIFDIVEVVRTKTVETQKYINIYNSNEAHELSDNLYQQMGGEKRDLFPHLIIIDNVKHIKDLYVSDDIKVIQLDFNFSDFSKIFV